MSVIKVENLSKQYRLGQVGTGSLSHDLNRLWHKARGKEDPYLKIGEENNRESKGNSDYVWALKDINFDIEQGDRVGIIGRNGAGKSTLLKILSRTTSPTTGSVKIKGKVASLLEVGTGFHPDLSGRDNIFLNGAILGMSKRDIKSRFDEIVDFAGVERYIDTPVKRYSSGMYVRLAFAVAAHLESDILIVDEVLAVGDAEFQKKCLGKMGDVSKGEGKTVLFVSHNMAAVKQLCNNAILINNGKVDAFENTSKVLGTYFSQNNSLSINERKITLYRPTITGAEVDFDGLNEEKLICSISFKSPFLIEKPNIGIVLRSANGNPVFGTNFKIHPGISTKDSVSEGIAVLTIAHLPIHSGTYTLSIYLGDEWHDYDERIDYISFTLDKKNTLPLKANTSTVDIGPLQIDAKWVLNAN